MLIKGKGPYTGCDVYVIINYDQGYRKSACIYKDSKFLKCIGFAKYLIEAETNLIIPEGYEVDHIDGDRTNDSLSNLQIISKEMNILKQRYETGNFKKYVRLLCPYCNKPFDIESRNFRVKLRFNKYMACSRSCSGKLTNLSSESDFSGTLYRNNYEYIVGYYYDFSEIINLENELTLNKVKFVKRYY